MARVLRMEKGFFANTHKKKSSIPFGKSRQDLYNIHVTIIINRNSPFVYRLGHKIFILERVVRFRHGLHVPFGKGIGCSTSEFTLVDYPTVDDRLSNEVLKSSGRLKQEVNNEQNSILFKF